MARWNIRAELEGLNRSPVEIFLFQIECYNKISKMKVELPTELGFIKQKSVTMIQKAKKID